MYPKLLLSLVFCLISSIHIPAAPGDLDPTFGIAGRALSSVGKISFDQGRAAALQADGKIVVIGDTVSDSQYSVDPANLIILRLNADGSRDSSFGIGGLVVKRLRSFVSGAAVVLQTDGKIVIGGYVIDEATLGVNKRAFLLMRLLPSGAYDNSFGVDGRVITVLNSTQDTTLTSLALQPDGKIVATGYSGTANSPLSLIAARYNADGMLDNSFDGDGKKFIDVNPAGNRGNSVKIQADGKIVIGGSLRETTGTITDFLVVRLNTDGSFDNTFDSDGKLTTKIGTSTSAVNALSLQSDGKIVAVGNSNIGANRNIALARYNGNGSLDSSFDGDGIVVTDILDELASSAAIQPDGKILVGGQAILAPNTPFHYLVSRYNGDGTPDLSFDGDGRVVTAVTTMTDRANALLLQGDGRLVLAGYSLDILNSDVSLARYNTDGSLDGSFDGDGKAIHELANANDGIYDTAIQPDGKIVAAGYAFGGLFAQPALSRFLPNGAVDTTFGNQGSIILPVPESSIDTYSNNVVIQPDGKIVFSINSYEGGNPFTAGRLNPDGSFDNSFGTNGIASISIGPGDGPRTLALQPDGKVVIAGMVSAGTALARLNANGTPDASFGVNGTVQTKDPSVAGFPDDIAMQADGKIVISGSGFGGGGTSFFTSRYTVNGALDTTFGGTGSVYTSTGGFGSALTVAVQTDGKIVAGGIGAQAAVAVRYNSNGTPDLSFDGDGKVVVQGQSSSYFVFRDLAIQSNGKLVFVGSQEITLGGYGPDILNAVLFRFNGDGSPDTSFGANGQVVNPVGDHNSIYYSVDLLPNGKIIAGGLSSNGINADFTLVRYNGDLTGPRSPFDFDGDGKTDIGIFRPSGGEWWVNRSGDGQTFALQFGSSTDKIVPADYTGDGKADVAVWRPSSGEWYVLRSDDFSFFALPFGTNGDVPVPADYDADGKADFAIFRPSSSTWFISQSSGAPTRIVQFGATGDQPVVSDYDGDGKADIGIFRQAASGAEWWIDRSTTGLLAMQFGGSTDKAVQGDYTGDGKADIAIWRPSTGEWFIVRSENFSFYGFPFGTTGDVVAPGDYDGDGKFDATVFRPSSATWFISRTTAGTHIVQFGATGDRPLPNAFVP